MIGAVLVVAGITLLALAAGVFTGWVLGYDRGELAERRRCETLHMGPAAAVRVTDRIWDGRPGAPATRPMQAVADPLRARPFTDARWLPGPGRHGGNTHGIERHRPIQ